MEKKLEGMKKHIEFLYDELELKEKEVSKLKESAEHANTICRKNTEYAQEILRAKCDLSQQLENKEKEIHDLKNEKYTCSTPGTRGWSRLRDRMLAMKNRNNTRKSVF